MASLTICGIILGLFLEVLTQGPPRFSWKHHELNLLEFKEPDILNYSSFLLDEDKKTLYVGAREIILELDIENITVKKKQVLWKVPETVQSECVGKDKSVETDCRNYIRVLQKMNASHLYVCGTYAYRPSCDYLSVNDFKLENNIEDGKGKCPYNPSKSFASVMVDGELYSGTESNFLGSQYVIYRSSSTNKMITYYAPAWLKEPRFVHADVIRESVNSANGDDDKIYFFFTEVNVELPQDLTKFFIPRIARVCKHDMGGRTVLQDRWTSFLKAKLVCWVPELNIVFDEVLDVLILKAPNWKDTVIYALFRSHWDYSMDSAVCKYKMSTVDEVFSRGTHMEEVIVLNMYQSWFRRQETFSSPRPGECINDNIRNNNIQSSKDLPSVILEFLKKSPMIHDSVLPVGNRPQMVFKNMNYTQIAVDQVRALDSRTYDIIFISTEDGNVHKTVVIDSKWHIIEEIQLLPNPEPIKELLLSSGQKKSLYAGSDERLVQSPVEFCEKHQSCVDCILARDPYCAWSTDASLCVNQIMHRNAGGLIQRLNGNFSVCPPVKHSVGYQNIVTQHGQYAALRLPCHLNSGLSRAMWMKNGVYLAPSPSKYEIVGDGDLLILNISQSDQGNYTCFLVQKVEIGDRKELVAAYTLNLIDRTDGAASSPFLYLFLLFLLLFLALLVYTCYPRCLPLLFPETINSSCYSGLAAEKRFDGSCW